MCYMFAPTQVYLGLFQKVVTMQILLWWWVWYQILLLRPSYLMAFSTRMLILFANNFNWPPHRLVISCCPSCCGIALAPLTEGTNTWGLIANSIWQTGITHIPEFGCLRYVHVSTDTYSHFLMATSHSGEMACDTIQHWRTCFTALGLPDTISGHA